MRWRASSRAYSQGQRDLKSVFFELLNDFLYVQRDRLISLTSIQVAVVGYDGARKSWEEIKQRTQLRINGHRGPVPLRYIRTNTADNLLQLVLRFVEHFAGYRVITIAVNQVAHQVVEYGTFDT